METVITLTTNAVNAQGKIHIQNPHLSSGYYKDGATPDDFNRLHGLVRMRSSYLRGIAGDFEVWCGDDRVGTLFYDNPFIGSAECRVDWRDGWSGRLTWDTSGFAGIFMDVSMTMIWRNTRPAIRLPIPAVGTGAVRGRLTWDRSNVTPRPGNSYAQAAQKLLMLQVKAPKDFLVLDPVLKPSKVYQGQLGEYDDKRLVGKVRWLSVSDDQAVFEIYDLPTDVPLSFQYRRQVPTEQLFGPGSANLQPDPLSMIPPGKGKPQFVVELESTSRWATTRRKPALRQLRYRALGDMAERE